jgi:hypothetical protein
MIKINYLHQNLKAVLAAMIFQVLAAIFEIIEFHNLAFLIFHCRCSAFILKFYEIQLEQKLECFIGSHSLCGNS